MEEPIRDIGINNPFSMKGGQIFKFRSQFMVFGAYNFVTSFNYHYKVTPRRYKVHRSIH